MTQQEFFSRYRFNVRTDKLGGGSFGTVYKAYDNVLDREVAVKVSEVKVMGGKEFSLMDEFRAIENLPAHPNIANYEKVFTFDMPQGVYDYAVIQYYPHGNLKDLIRERKLTETEKINIARQLLTGLAFLHQNRVVHRDLKPSNILIHIRNRDNGEEIIPKIADFGLSKIAEGGNSRFDNSFGGGTLEYSSPEQLMGLELRFNTDLWAYSVIVYELFTGKPLFAPKTESTGSVQREKEIYDQILHGEIAQKLEALPEKWKQDMLSCLVKEPDKRAKSASELSIITGEGKEIEVPVQEVFAGYGGSTQISNGYGGQTVVAPEGNIAPQGQSKPMEGEKNSTSKTGKSKVFIGIGVGIIALAIGWWFMGRPSSQKILNSPVDTQADYAMLVKQGDSLANSNDVEGAKVAYNKALALKPEDNQLAGKLSLLVAKPSGAGIEKTPNGIPETSATKSETSKSENVQSWKQAQKELGKLYDNVRWENGYFAISNKDIHGFADKEGKLITPIIYGHFTGEFSEGLARVELKDKFGYVNMKGEVVIPIKYEWGGDFNGGMARVKNDNKKFGFVNKSGDVVIPFKYTDGDDSFHNGLCRTVLNKKFGFIDRKGNEVIPFKYESAIMFSEGLAFVKLGEKWGCINTKGETVLPFKYYSVPGGAFDKGRAEVSEDGSSTIVIDKKGRFIEESVLSP